MKLRLVWMFASALASVLARPGVPVPKQLTRRIEYQPTKFIGIEHCGRLKKLLMTFDYYQC
ncbi:hypothetical protein PGT21_014707 [Puccinia graminis f. sp. tritici]|uniref:Uncharacterized protein n=1 Tax=Puccinia graminis f. sp. tritici TaxID=56615 RepID=A0A5B0PXK8_PUCGR|nr:hypothetical protein PGTUg99_018428 [Puccinia graminis f. sp. tritici]KAA1105661.1 hypothetical protein PGT21_014707 [Puccinia graminis f. sp. tritici]